jgi:glycosyltransferase involved in cell wall biosynthesis
MTEKTIIVLDPRGVISLGGNDVIKRHILYAQALTKSKPTKKFNLSVFSTLICASFEDKTDVLDLNLISKPTFNSYKYAKYCSNTIKEKGIDVGLLVAGDPWESYWSAYFLNKFMKRQIPIQIQVHGDIGNPLWRKINFRNRVRFLFIRMSLKRCQVIRCVSKKQKLNLITAFGIDSKKIKVIPVPIEIVNKPLVPIQRPRTIGLVGRIHEDRGIWGFVEVVKNLNKYDSNFKLLIAGDGPARDKFIQKLEKVITKNRIKYLGQISQGKLRNTWKSVGLLVSMAPVESYGRVLRESLSAGVPVWATASSGVQDLLDSAEPGTVKILDLEKDERELYKDFESLLRVKVGPKFRDKFIKENNSYADKLAKSWIDTIENFNK